MDVERFDPKVLRALEKFIAEQRDPMSTPQAITLIVRLWLRQNGYLTGEVERLN